MSRGNPPGYDVQRFWRAMSAEKQTRRCAARVGKLLDLRPVGAGCRESGQLSLRCSPWNFILASAARTGAKQSALTPNHRQWADTTAISLRARLRCSPCCPCRTSPDAPPDGRGVSINGRAQSRRARTNPGHAKLKFGSAGGLSCRMLPGSRTRDVICKAAPFSVSQRVPPTNGSPPSPRATPRPTARFIEDNIVLCVHRLRRCHADCSSAPRARAGSHRASLQASGTPAARCRR